MSGGNNNNISSSNVGLRSKDAAVLRQARGRMQQRSAGSGTGTGSGSVSRSGGGTITPASAATTGLTSTGGGSGMGGEQPYSSSAMSSVSAASSRNYQHQQPQHPPSSRQHQQHSVTWSTANSNTSSMAAGVTTTARTTGGGTMNYSSGGGYPSSTTTTTTSAAAAARTTTSLEDRTLQATEFMTTVLASARKQPPPSSAAATSAATSHELSPRRIIPGVPKRQLTNDFSLDQTTATAFDTNITLSRNNLQQSQQSQSQQPPPFMDRTSTMGTTASSGTATMSHANVTSRVKLGAKIMTTTSTTTNRGLQIDTSGASSFMEANQTSLPEPLHGEDDDEDAEYDDDDKDADNATTGTMAIAARQEPTVTDAACLPLGGTFRLGMHYYAGFVAVESLPHHHHHHPSVDTTGDETKSSNDQHDHDSDDDLACKVTTRGLGLVAGGHGDASSFGPQHDDDDVGFGIVPVHCISSHVLCYGDVIRLQAPPSSASSDHGKNSGKERYLGIQALSLTMMTTSSGVAAHGSGGSSSSNLVFAVGLYRSLLHKKANQWQILDASDWNQPVPVGPGAQHYHEKQNDGNNNNTTILPPNPAKPVRSGDAILLRNVVCGGILSISAHDDGPIVYTDSYHQTTTSHGAAAATTHEKPGEDSSSLLTRLERHNVFYPTSREVFHFLLPTIPPTAPLWVMGGGPLDRRPFLNGTYLLDPHRHDKLMGHGHHHDVNDNDSGHDFRFNNSLFLDYSGRMQECGNEQLQTPQGQEIVLVDELIGSFLGLEGTYIRAVDSSLSCYPSIKSNMADLEFQLVDTPHVQFDMGLRSLVGELLALSTNFCRVNTFTGNRLPGYEYGSVMQALCKTLDEMLQEHCVYIAKLEIQFRQTGMTMRRLQILVRPSLHSMSVLERVTRAVANEKGGSMINALRRLQVQVYQGDGIADAILYKLLESASIPYMSMLQEWLDHGILIDPHEEFVIRRNNHEENTDWDVKYSIAVEHLLEGFFSTNLTVDRVLATGKYWNAVCTCRNHNSERVANTRGGHFVLSYHANGTKISSYIHTMYYRASRELVHLLMGRFNLVGALRLLKRYFLLDQGDFFVNFMDAAEEELSSQLTNLSFGRIQHWLNTSIQITEHQGEEGIVMASSSITSSGSSQEQQQPRHLSPNELRCSFARETLMVHLDRLHGSSGVIARNSPATPKRSAYGGIPEDGPTGLDVFMMDFTTIPFPVSLVLSQKAVSNYQLLFRLLFYTKQVERRLVSAWMDHQAMKELPSLQLPALRRALLLRQRMLHCVQNLIYYMMFEVIEPNWLEMEAGIASPAAQKDQTVDDILAVHSKFLERTVEACLLTNSDLVCALTRLLRTCLLFSNQMELFMKRIKIHDDRQQVAIEKQKLIQRSLNDRGGGTRPATNLDRKALRGSMQRDRLARQERIQEQTRRVEREVSQPAYSSMVARYDDIFSQELVDFLRLVSRSNESSHSQRVNLCIRLDYNGFLSESRSVA